MLEGIDLRKGRRRKRYSLPATARKEVESSDGVGEACERAGV